MKREEIPNYVLFKAFDSLGVQVGDDIQFSNTEILSTINENTTVSSQVIFTRSGLAVGGAENHPLGFSFTVSCAQKDSWNKIERLYDAVKVGYKIRFTLQRGRLLYDTGFETFLEYDLTFDRCVLQFERQTPRQIFGGMGLIHRSEFLLTVYEGIQLPLPQSSGGGAGGIGVSGGVGVVIPGGGVVNVLTFNH